MRTTTKALMTSIAIAGFLPGTAMAETPPADIQSLQPVENKAYQVARIAPFQHGGAERWRVRAHFTVQNNGKTAIKLAKTFVEYPGGPPVIGIDAEDSNDDPAIDSRIIGPGKSAVFIAEDGMARPTGKPGDRSLFLPVPTRMLISLRFEGYSEVVSHGVALQTYHNKTPQGSYRFPAKHTDLAAGERWTVGIHAFSRSQKFGYDFGVSRYDAAAKAWVGNKPNTDGKKNSDWLIFGKPVHAMASGKIVKCMWSSNENSMPGKKDSTGQNHFVVDHGNGELAVYGHLKAGSVNANLCPHDVQENKYGLNIPVVAGQFLGRAGNNGNSTKPHLHVHIVRGANGKPDSSSTGTGLPLYFRAIRSVSANSSKTIGPGPFALNTVNGQMVGGPFNIIDLSPLPIGTP